MLKFRNSLTNEIEEFKPLGGEVKMYTCGPTVWNFAHIGNFRTFIFGDVLRRYLKHKGYEVRQVMNLTDVNDRTIAAAERQGISLDELTRHFVEVFWEDIDSLNCERPEYTPRATEHIPQIIRLIEKLIANGHAYESGGSVYYRIASFPDYGKLSRLTVDSPFECERMDADRYKKVNACDFVLWKAVGKDEPVGWDAPFGRGRPGWHIECSAMAMEFLGETFDIHVGGVDLKFPHHENEIAQSEGATGKQFVRYWLHGEVLNVEDERMSKTSNNVLTLRDITKLDVSPLAVRYLLLSVPFDKPLNFTPENLQGAQATVKKLHDFFRRLRDEHLPEGSTLDFHKTVDTFTSDFEAAMDNNLNTAAALAALHSLIREVNISLSNNTLRSEDRREVFKALEGFDAVLGIFCRAEKEWLPADIAALIKQRNDARRSRDFGRSDEIRDQLCDRGFVLEDTPFGVRWKRK
ncbi:MAG: cysteine--tRNA ligase [Pyrinomonadaceae bacterium]